MHHKNQNFEEEFYYIAGRENNNNESSNSYRSANSAESVTRNKKGNSLMHGAYDEREAHEAFQQALAEWRNGPTKSSSASNAKKQTNSNKPASQAADSNVGTDTSDLTSSASRTNQVAQNSMRIKELERTIQSNHSLSYAERMLLQKYRRNDSEFNTIANGRQLKSNFDIFFHPNLFRSHHF